jgi:hypothetical protein
MIKELYEQGKLLKIVKGEVEHLKNIIESFEND